MHLSNAREEGVRTLEACQPQARGLLPLRVDEHDGGDTDDAVLPRELLHCRIVRIREIGLDAREAIELAGDAFVAEGLLVELLTRDAPVGVEVDDGRLSGSDHRRLVLRP